MSPLAGDRYRRDRIPEFALSSRLASRWVLGSVLALALAACSSGSPAASASGSPAPTPLPSLPAASSSASSPTATPAVTPSPTAAPSASSSTAGSANTGDSIQLKAQNIQFSTDQLRAPARHAFAIAFENDDPGVPHNVDILDASNTSVFKGAIFPGAATQIDHVPALKAGTYTFRCDVHPTLMNGTLTVK